MQPRPRGKTKEMDMAHLTDRARAERLVLIRVLGRITRQCDGDAALVALWERLYRAGLADLPHAEGLKVHRRVVRLADAATEGFDGVAATPIVAVHHLVQELIDEGLFHHAGDPLFLEAYDRYSAAAQDGEGNADLLDAVERSARKAAKRMRATLAELGCFRAAA